MTLEIAWHNLDPSPAIEANVRKRYEKLEKHCPNITSARIAIDQPHHSHQHPRNFAVTLDIHVPGTTIIAGHGGNEEIAADLHQLVHHIFDSAGRQVQEYNHIRQGKVKRHSAPSVDEELDLSAQPQTPD